MSASVEPWLREILRCPACRGVLTDRLDARGAPVLDCAGACPTDPTAPGGRAYRIEDGIPVLLLDEARPLQGGAPCP